MPTRLSAAGSVPPQVFAGGFLKGVSATPDGRFVVFSAALDIPRYEVAVWDRRRGTVRKVSAGPDDDPDFGHAEDPSVSADGRFVAFTSATTNLVPGDTNGVADVVVRDLRRGLTRRGNLGPRGVQADGGSTGVSLSADGRLLAFDSTATNLLRSPVRAHGNVYVRDLRAGALRRVSRTPSGAEPDGNCSTPVLSANGRFLGYDSTASDLVPDDTNGLRDGFVVDLRHATTQRVTLYPPENRG